MVGHALGVVLVVHRVGQRDAHDVAAAHLLGPGEAELLELARGELDEVVVVHRPQLVALEGEVLEADAGGVGSGTIHGLHER